MRNYRVTQTMRGPVDKDGRASHENEVVYPSGKQHVQMFYADPKRTLARLRHNLAWQFWFDRMRARAAASVTSSIEQASVEFGCQTTSSR